MATQDSIKPHPKTQDLTNKVFGRLVAQEWVGKDNSRHALWLCRCNCGKECIVSATNLKTGNSQSCGCLKAEKTSRRRKTHGMSHTGLYNVWNSMISRCENRNQSAYPRYGGRGIRVCNQWHDFATFYADMGDPPPGYTLERIDNNGDYCPDNCVWASRTDQARNKSTNRYITFNGKIKTLMEWSEITGIHRGTIQTRLDDLKWTIEDALTCPARDNSTKSP